MSDVAPGGRWQAGSAGGAVARVRAANPGPMTLDGTNTWVVRGPQPGCVVVDPGPADDAHLSRVLAVAAAAGPVAAVLLTHRHADHAAGAARCAALAGCPVRAAPELADGTAVPVGGSALEVIAVPGHTADSLAFLLRADRLMLTGDTVLGAGTSVVAWPDGDLRAYLGSLRRLRALAAGGAVTAVLPGHGPVRHDPLPLLDGYLAHRAERLDQVRAAVAAGSRRAAAVVAAVYPGLDPVLRVAATQTTRAQPTYLGLPTD